MLICCCSPGVRGALSCLLGSSPGLSKIPALMSRSLRGRSWSDATDGGEKGGTRLCNGQDAEQTQHLALGLCFYPVCSRSRGFESSAFCFQGAGFTEPRGSVQRVGQTSAQHPGTSLLPFQRPWKQSGGALSSAEPSRELVCIPEEREIQFFDK